MASIKFNDIPSTDFNIEDGEYPCVILDAKLVVTSGGYKAIELTYEHLGSPKFKVNYDRCIYGTESEDFNMENKAVRFGCNKLKKLNEATVNMDELDPAILVRVLISKKVYVKVKVGDKYPEVDGLDAFRKYEEPNTSTNVSTPINFDVNAEDDPFNM